jgi:asparagine synthase (glutamine-hydrolysing)
MCGIAGLFDRHGRADLGRLQAMSRLLRDRGPDDEGLVLVDPVGGQSFTHGGADTPANVFTSGLPWAPGAAHGDPATARYGLALGHRRLAIVDLEPTGHQPMCDPDHRRWIVYNGEIYNHVELRAELERAGRRFLGRSDTEVILAAYEAWGEASLARLNGMFAFALWDAERRRLFCARDRLGVKPFYYQFDGQGFAFASEARALALTQPHRIQPHLPAVRDLLALDWVDHESTTFFAGIHPLPPGHWLSVGADGFEVRRWWGLDPDRRANAAVADLATGFAELFTDSVRLRLRADVEVGSCLSGGLDSSAVVTTAARLANRGLHAFTCAYDEGPAFDERAHVRAVAEASGATSHVVVPDGSDLWRVFDQLADRQGEPTAGPGVYSQWKVMQLAHGAGLKVLLDGQGGDETLAGYFRYLPTRLRDLLAAGDWAGFARLFGPVSDRLGLGTALLHTFEPWLPAPLVEALRRRYGQGKDRVLSSTLRRVPSQAPDPRRAGSPWRGRRTALWEQLAFDATVRQLPSLLRYEDRSSMEFGIETRLPFLDYRLVEFAFALPDEERLDGVTTKAIARRALGDRVPATVLARRDKMGFETPTDLWWRGRYAQEVRARLARTGPFQDWVDAGAIGTAVDDYLSGRRDIGLQAWRWLSLEAWAQRYLARDPRVTARGADPSTSAGRHLGYVEAVAHVEAEATAGATVA